MPTIGQDLRLQEAALRAAGCNTVRAEKVSGTSREGCGVWVEGELGGLGSVETGQAGDESSAWVIIPATAQATWSLVRTADPTDRGLIVGSAVRTEHLAGVMIKARVINEIGGAMGESDGMCKVNIDTDLRMAST